MNSQEKFKELLKTVFQYSKDKIELDFGVYKVFKHNEKEIYEFVESKLPSFLEEQFNKNNIDKSINLEDCYNDILNFFMKYYEGGDFYPAQYFSPNAKKHMLRHNGEEVIFSWANKDQYYIKNLSNFNDYSFVVPQEWFEGSLITQLNATVHFKMDLDSIEELAGNKKDTRNYILLDKKTELNNDGLIIYFGFKSGQAITSEILYQHLIDKKINISSIDEIERHLKKFISVRGSDFFIHKNLYKFLTEELDYYIKSELLDLDKPSTLTRAKITKIVAEYIIQFLSRLEELQRVLWEKKKFAYDTNYIITLDKINNELLQKIVSYPEFENQIKEWVDDLKLIETFDKDSIFSDDLKDEYKYLPLDTKYFEDDILKYEILGQFESLDKTIQGQVVYSDNWQGMNYCINKYRSEIDLIYIDPPFNTGEDFAYKDNYQTSSWLSLIDNRIELSKKFLSQQSSFMVHLDHNANYLSRILMNNHFKGNYQNEIVWNKGREGGGSATLPTEYNTIQVYKNSNTRIWNPPRKPYKISTVQNIEKDEQGWFYTRGRMGRTPTEDEVKSGAGLKTYVLKDTTLLKEEAIKVLTTRTTADSALVGDVWDNEFIGKQSKVNKFDTEKPESLIRRLIESATNESSYVMDFFGGGGTTFTTALKLRRKFIGFEIGKHFFELYESQNKKTKVIEIKIGILGRIKQTLFGIKNQGITKDVSWKGGGFVKYYSLEQYEDTLHNTSFTNGTLNSKLTTLDKYEETLPYLYQNKFISLAKDVSLQNSPSLLLQIENEFLCDPFNYRLEIYKDNKYIPTKIDLVETFNTLMGFEINSIKQKFFSLNDKRYLFIDAKKDVVVWREVSKKEINDEFIKQEEEFIKEYIDTTKKVYMNAINSYYTKAFLDGQANETLYAFRKILMNGVKDGN